MFSNEFFLLIYLLLENKSNTIRKVWKSKYKKHIPRESYHMPFRALDIKLGLDINQNCYQKFVTFVTFVAIG